ncbi:MAG: hypothetical protein FJZ67_10585 [Bacteroidetes bacterium]|nr:hypothetical protein [Bacteroidota bacterium]
MKKANKSYFSILFVLYCFAIVFWNATKTHLPDPLVQKVKILSIENGHYHSSWFETSGPFNQKILVDHKDIGGLYCNSKQKGISQIVGGKELLLKIECLEATSWWDFFTFGRNFNYRLVSIPAQNNDSIEEDSLIFTTNFWIASSILSLIAFYLLAGSLIKKK